MRIDLVCQVVDNYGDIAVVWRLAQALVQDGPGDLAVRLLVDDLGAFAALNPNVDPRAARQELPCGDSRITVLRSADVSGVAQPKADVPADVLVEAFGAPTPAAWFQAFVDAAKEPGLLRARVIVHLEYLTAEPWSERYHLLPSPLGFSGVDRRFFVPGFRPRTGGLVFTDPPAQPAPRGPEDWLMTMFSYEHDFTRFWVDLMEFLEDRDETARVLVFAGRSRPGALDSWTRLAGRPGVHRVTVVDQPLVDQDTYTSLLASADFNVVRGEESWVQALLVGRPFLWHAYLQPEGHQSVKVDAFLDVWEPWFEPEAAPGAMCFAGVAKEFRSFNRRLVDSTDEPPLEGYRVFWENRDLLTRVQTAWLSDLRKNAKLSRRLLEFLETYRL